MNTGMLGILVLSSVIILLMSFIHLKREFINPQGKGSEKSTARTLSSFARMRGFKALSNVKLAGAQGEVLIENMLIGYFGILLIRTLGAKGEYYGTLEDEKWAVMSDGKKTLFENPIKQLDQEQNALRALFVRKKIYNVPIEHIVYISSKSTKTSVFITHNGEILLAGKLSGYLSKTKFEKDLKLDVQNIANTVLSD